MRTFITGLCLTVGIIAFSLALGAQQPPGDGPVLAADGTLQRPSSYREWTFLTSSYNLSYGPNAQSAGGTLAPFNNVFVNPSSYRAFMKTGRWPDGTMFALEIRRASNAGLLSKDRRYQSEMGALEVEVKDSRLPGGWAWFDFGRGTERREAASPLPETAGCLACHTSHGAVEKTFVQFYPTLLEVARQKGTVNSAYDPAHEF